MIKKKYPYSFSKRKKKSEKLERLAKLPYSRANLSTRANSKAIVAMKVATIVATQVVNIRALGGDNSILRESTIAVGTYGKRCALKK